MNDLTRRAFLGATAVVGSGAFQRIQGANSRINIGVIGIGTRGSYLLEMALDRAKEIADVQVVAVCDVYQRRLNRAAAAAAGAKAYVYHQELLEHPGLDALLVATPDQLHAPITLDAMRRGKDVYCEKPMAHTVEEALLVRREARERNCVLQFGVQSNSWSKWHKAKEAIANGMLGEIVSCHGTYSRNSPTGEDWNWPIDPDAGPEAKGEAHIEWKQWLGPAPERPFDADRFFRFRKYWDYSGGIATDLNYHIVAPFHLAVKNEFPARVVGLGGLWTYHDREVPDTFLNAADYPSRFQILVQSSQHSATGPVTMIRGHRATMILGEDWEGRERDTITIVPEKPFAAEFKQKWGKEELIIPGAGNEGDRKHLDNFIECIRSRQEPNCGADLAAKVMVHIGLAVRSYKEGKMFYFDPAEGRVLDHPEA